MFVYTLLFFFSSSIHFEVASAPMNSNYRDSPVFHNALAMVWIMSTCLKFLFNGFTRLYCFPYFKYLANKFTNLTNVTVLSTVCVRVHADEGIHDHNNLFWTRLTFFNGNNYKSQYIHYIPSLPKCKETFFYSFQNMKTCLQNFFHLHASYINKCA